MNILMSGKQAKEVDTFMIEKVGVPSLVLMEKAAMAVAGVVMEHEPLDEHILCVCGNGNNGADGVAVARILTQHGYRADCLLLGDNPTEEMKKQIEIARNMGVHLLNQVDMSGYRVIIDAIFGIGLSRLVQGTYEELINEINTLKAHVYAVDIPSGIHSSTGNIMNVAVKANKTITFGVMKNGLVLYPGADYAGEVIIADIGYSQNALMSIQDTAVFFEHKDLTLLPPRPANANKGTFGRVLVIAGSNNMSGASYLSAKAAYRAGAGLVKVMTAKENREILQIQLPEAIVSTYTQITDNELMQELEWATAVVIGPGLGLSAEAKRLFLNVIRQVKVPTVVDADAINLLASLKQKEVIELGDNFVLTPHLKEMSRFTGVSLEEMKEDLISFAKRSITNNSYVLALKDTRTIVAKQNRTYVNISGNCGMSTGGSGDVLTGIIAAFLAQGMGCYEAATLGVYVHGLAGDVATDHRNKFSVMANDLIESLGEVLKG